MLRKRKKSIKGSISRSLVEGTTDSLQKTEKARRAVLSLCEAEGLELVHLEHRNESRGRVFRIYVDKPGGITLNDCANLSRNLGDILDVEWDDWGSYYLEVSSPGIERPLNKLEDFTRFCGKKIKIKLVVPLDGKKDLCGEILDIFGNIIKLRVGSKTIALEYGNVARARLMALNGDS